MKRSIIGAALLTAMVVVVRQLGPALRHVAISKCEAMFERMPDEFPPKRMLRGIEEIRDQNARILHHIEGESLSLMDAR